ncbi:MAG: hypothetical protein HYY15_03855 [Candidatus Omnitrophica bacterium]|nr:hypothetical protein [Candidatus Omnitrophota bacterium]
MADQIETLRKLQVIDTELFRLRAEQRQKPLALEQAKQRVTEEQAKGQALDARVKALQMQQKEKELELSTREGNVKKFQLQLFQVKTNKEYAAIQQEIAQAKADISLAEEGILAVLEAIDLAMKQHKAQFAAVAKQQDAYRAEEAVVAKELAVVQAQLADYERQRGELLPLILPTALSTYERVLANRDGLALVPLIQDSCGGCHMVQPPQVVNEVRLNAKLVMCQSCSRILCLQDGA